VLFPNIFRPAAHRIHLKCTHFRNQLTALRRRLLLDEGISEDDQKTVLSKIDGSLNLWQSPTVTSVFFTYVFPATGPIISLWSHLVPASLPDWTENLVVPSISYGLGLFGTAFLVKRGLMLGAAGRSAYFPGALTQSGAYIKEREILNRIGVTAFEFPIDILVLAVSCLLGLNTWKQQNDLFSTLAAQHHVPFDTDSFFYLSLGIYTFHRLCSVATKKETSTPVTGSPAHGSPLWDCQDVPTRLALGSGEL
jgi:hypothetical protein